MNYSRLIFSIFFGVLFGVLGFQVYEEKTYKGMWQQFGLMEMVPALALQTFSNPRFYVLHVREYSDGEDLFTVLVDCKEDTDSCAFYQSGREMGTTYTGNGYAVIRTIDGEIRIFAEGFYKNPKNFVTSLKDNIDNIDRALEG
ncbi:hypothetical protein [Microbulbifer epialgicus]|uniref:Uncharacterized protein n=1 Tax=Microbulbifer epialgicus TaxID=393907 RepID=A0ABV4NTV1_9GAMM